MAGNVGMEKMVCSVINPYSQDCRSYELQKLRLKIHNFSLEFEQSKTLPAASCWIFSTLVRRYLFFNPRFCKMIKLSATDEATISWMVLPVHFLQCVPLISSCGQTNLKPSLTVTP